VTTIDTTLQCAILLMGAATVWLLCLKSPRWQRWGCAVGFAAEPFWLWSSWRNEQWGVFVLCWVYGAVYAVGWWRRWANISEKGA